MLIKTVNLSDRWPYGVYSPDTDPAELGPFEPIKKLWDNKRRSGAIPAWRDFELTDFEGWYGYLNVEDIISRSPFDARYRLWGTQWVNIFGFDHTGKLYSDCLGSLIDRVNVEFWTEMCTSPNIGMGRGVLSWLNSTDRYHNQDYWDITLPLSYDGQTVDQYLVVISFQPNI